MNQQKINNVFALDSKERYDFLLRKVADFETIYLITDNEDGYVMIGSDGVSVLPVFPEKAFAELFLKDDWKGFNVVEYSIYEFMDWLEELAKDEVQIAGFPNSELNTVRVPALEMKNHLLFELGEYE